MERKVTFEVGHYYHLSNHGVAKQEVFLHEDDYRLFQKLLFFRNAPGENIKASRLKDRPLEPGLREGTLVDICAYALLPNRFGLLVREHTTGGISKFMSKLQTSFAKHINTKYDRSGPLMCRPFKAGYVSADDHLRQAIADIHLSPLVLARPNWQEKGIQDLGAAYGHLSTYPYSSYQDYFVADRDETAIINKEALPFFINDLEDVGNMYRLVTETDG